MAMRRKLPVTLNEYKSKHCPTHGDAFAEARYAKAKFVYSHFMDRPDWHDRDFGKLTKPEHAFEIWWDV